MGDQQLVRIRNATQKDSKLIELIRFIRHGWPEDDRQLPESMKPYWSIRDDLTVSDDIILKSNRIFVPLELRRDILERLHANHQGMEYATKLARETVYWPGMTEQ